MCGIVGYMGPVVPGPVLSDMMAAIAHRGPDSNGEWADPEAGIALGHLRLAIVDLTPTGHQPMTSASGRYVLTYNGEIYNHMALRCALEEAGPSNATPAVRHPGVAKTLR